MKLSEQVSNREQSIKLESLGVKYGDANFYWGRNVERIFSTEDKETHKEINLWHDSDYVPAFTVAELGVMIPAEYFLPSNKDGAWWMSHGMTFEKTEAEARATMLIQLLQANKVTPEAINQRLTH